MNKRGQIYILVAIILAVALYVLLTKTNIIFETVIEDDFEELSQNYDLESAKFVNSLLTQPDPDVGKEFCEFTKDFTDYSERQNPDFGLIYAFNYEGSLYIGNFLPTGEIFVKSGGKYYPISPCVATGSVLSDFGTTLSGELDCSACIVPFNSALSVNLVIDGIEYEAVPVPTDRPELIIIGSEIKEKQKKVYIDEFINGEYKENFATEFCGQDFDISGEDVKETKGEGYQQSLCKGNNINFYKNEVWCEKEGGTWDDDKCK